MTETGGPSKDGVLREGVAEVDAEGDVDGDEDAWPQAVDMVHAQRKLSAPRATRARRKGNLSGFALRLCESGVGRENLMGWLLLCCRFADERCSIVWSSPVWSSPVWGIARLGLPGGVLRDSSLDLSVHPRAGTSRKRQRDHSDGETFVGKPAFALPAAGQPRSCW